MMRPAHRHATLALTLALGLVAAACNDPATTDPLVAPAFGVLEGDRGAPRAFEVYTQNMFLGGDTGPLFTLDLTDPDAIGDVIAATATFYGQVLASDIPARVAAMAGEIGARRPHVVALQEAVAYVEGILDPATFEFTATAAGPDLLGSLMAEIAARGLPYGVAVVQPTTSIALPMGPPDAQGFPALGVQDRVVMLVRDDVEDFETGSGLYTARIPLGPTDFVRGWVRVTVEREGTPWHFVATHLETQGPSADHPIRQVHDGQAFELQNAVLAGLGGKVVLMGDLNSDAAADPSAPSWTATYGNLVDAGFVDVWAVAAGTATDDGLTCCLAPGRTLEERIDFVLLRSADGTAGGDDDGNEGDHRGYYHMEVVGDEPGDQLGGGLWPSDHAGLSASVHQPGATR